jgi:TonB family protein
MSRPGSLCNAWAQRIALALALTATSAALPAAAQPRPAKAAPKLTKPPKLHTFVKATYPEAERAGGKTATVVLQVAISATGTVDDAVVTESAGPAFDAAAVEAVKRFVFDPAEIDDRPAPVKILYRYTFTLEAEAPTTAVFEGVVRTRKGKRPLPGVTVELEGGGQATTDAAGRFHIDAVAPGKHAVSLRGEKFTALRTEETFEAGKRLDAAYEVEEQETPAPGAASDDLEIVVTAPPLRKQVVSTEVVADQARRVPGTGGDVLKVVENLPGVARATVGSGALVVWGAAPEDTRVYIDGVPVPRLYHDGGLRSVIHSDMVRSVELAPGGYGAAYGGGLGGLLTVELRPLDEPGFHGSVAADVFDAAGAVRATIGDKWSVAASARKSWLDALLPLVTSRDLGALFPIPRYADAALRVAYRPNPRASIEVGGLFSTDATDRTVASDDPAAQQSDSERLTWGRIYARYRRETEGGDVITVTPSFGLDHASTVENFGATPATLTDDAQRFDLRAVWRGKPAASVAMTAGLDAEVVSSALHRDGSVTLPPREGDIYVFGEPPSAQVNADSWNVVTLSAAPFGEADIALAGDRLHLVPGLRLDPYVLSGSRRTPEAGDTPSIGLFESELLFEPRLSATYDISPRMRVKAAYGRYHQLPAPEDLSAVFGNPLLPPSRADHFLAGALVRLTETISVEATGFYTTSADLAARSASPAPLLAQALEPTGVGRSYGVQVLLRKELSSNLFGWLSYTLMRSERRDDDGARWRLFDFDQTHVLTALASYRLPLGFEAGARVRVASGFPRTPVTGSYYDARADLYEPVFGVQNTIRIPPFFALDLRASKRFALGRTELEAYLDVQNVTNHANPEEIVYNTTYTQKGYITGLPVLPSLGLRFSW